MTALTTVTATTIAIEREAVYTARVSDSLSDSPSEALSAQSTYWRPARLAATGEWCVCAPGATFFVRLSDSGFPDEHALTSAKAERHACALADALNRIYAFTHAPRFEA